MANDTTISGATAGGGLPACIFHDLTDAPDDRALLRSFYGGLHLSEFPDPDEGMSLASMERSLESKAQGWYGANNYHIVLVTDAANDPIAGSICTYLADAAAGVIEFLVVAPQWRRRGLGARLLGWTETTLAMDAASRSGQALRCILAEMHDRCSGANDPDPRACARIWQSWGYRRLDFDYVRPALPVARRSARQLALLAKCPAYPRLVALPVRTLDAVLYEYLRWALRIERPEQCGQFQQMQTQFASRLYVELVPIDATGIPAGN